MFEVNHYYKPGTTDASAGEPFIELCDKHARETGAQYAAPGDCEGACEMCAEQQQQQSAEQQQPREILFKVSVREYYYGRENDFDLSVKAPDAQEAFVRAVAEQVYQYDEDQGFGEESIEAARELIKEKLGEGWTLETYFDAAKFNQHFDCDGSEASFVFYRPEEVGEVAEGDDAPHAVMVRAADRYRDEGMIEHLHGRLLDALNNMGEAEVLAIFGEDIDTQRELDKAEVANV